MAAKKTSSTFFEAQKFAQSLGGLLDALPSDANKQQVVSQLEVLIQFLSDLKTRLEGIPTQQDAGAARAALETLMSLFSEARSNPVLGTAIGIKATVPRPRPAAFTPEEIERARSAIARYDSLTIDEIRVALDRMSLRELRGVANEMGIRTTQRTAREALVHQVATKITNARGYRSLRDGTNQA